MSGESFVGVRIQGGLLPADLPSQLASGLDPSGNTLSPKDYHLATGETVRDAANRVWAYLRGVWTGYRDALAQLPADAPTTALTRERFLLVLLDQLGYGRVPTTGKGGIEVERHPFPVSHLWGATPIHLLGSGTALDTRTRGLAGAAGSSPQSMVQELLNRSDDHLWAILSNGQVLRLLRDSTSLVGSAYVEFDLEAIFDGDLFADFLLLYTLCQVSRVEVRDTEIGPASCRLEQWRTEAVESGSRALNLLRDGVVDALRTLGVGFLTHPANASLRDDLAAGKTSVSDVNHALLRVVYRLLFTFVAEDRGALLDPKADPQARQRYLDYFSTARLRNTARRRRGGRHGDRWQALTLVWRGLGSESGRPELGLPGVGGLFETGSLDFLADCELSNEYLLSAVRSLSLVREPKSDVLRVVDYRNLGAEELGSIYEALLEFVPQWDPATKQYTLDIASGNQRKDTGSYYTPTSLVESLLDTALEPVLDDAVKSADTSDGQVAALLAVTVCDPACGSGHFLVGAARRIAKRVAAIRTGDPEPAPEQVRAAMRDVVAGCVYGVDVNPLAAELAKVSLWMEALEPGKPLAYLDAQIKVGNALIGATPALLADGLPDEAFKPIEGDVTTIATATKAANKAERKNQGSLFDLGDAIAANTDLAAKVQQVVGANPLSLADVHVQQQRLNAYTDSDEYRQARLTADAWCAAFVWPLQPDAPTPITHATVAGLGDGTTTLSEAQSAEVARLAAEYRFFHWHLEFPHLFPTGATSGDAVSEATGWGGGFAVMLGNPPWEQIEIDETEFFSQYHPAISQEKRSSARRAMIEDTLDNFPDLEELYARRRRYVAGTVGFIKGSGKYPRTVSRRLNTYRQFAELFVDLMQQSGLGGIITPTGLINDLSSAGLTEDLVKSERVCSAFDFVNHWKTESIDRRFFLQVPNHTRFSLTTIAGARRRAASIKTARRLQDPRNIKPKTIEVQPSDISRISSETYSIPLFSDATESSIAIRTYRNCTLFRDTELETRQGTLNISTNDKHLRSHEELVASGLHLTGVTFTNSNRSNHLPVWEGKLFGAYNNSRSTFAGIPAERRFNKKASPRPTSIQDGELPLPRYWAPQELVSEKWPSKRNWVLSGKETTDADTSPRSSVFCVYPYSGLAHTCQIIFSDALPEDHLLHYLACLNSFAFDFFVRQKLVGRHLTASILRQLPVVVPRQRFCLTDKCAYEFTSTRTKLLSLSAYTPNIFDTSTSSESLDREIAISELDAAFFHLYGFSREEAEYAMDSFQLARKKDIETHNEYRTKRLILEQYDAMVPAAEAG
ncbi:SAM-dependent DNA methyltransferase [Rhodococcus sp. Eu-32]|uniref:Eco57I restriction-modification methylase domain-containing protein n=1 Tax=Rhodococcus sp. Eu-32 TaxID=1017319 RepID=UPI000DF1ED78|nr:DNA methyltransferase [Rhodococcus sp. Eu-32]RRQ27381.1 SAM-dependent DNA methyltransferase [Rhodococcus sp. Eu-32]